LCTTNHKNHLIETLAVRSPIFRERNGRSRQLTCATP
jgi:hypothetical protein